MKPNQTPALAIGCRVTDAEVQEGLHALGLFDSDCCDSQQLARLMGAERWYVGYNGACVVSTRRREDRAEDDAEIAYYGGFLVCESVPGPLAALIARMRNAYLGLLLDVRELRAHVRRPLLPARSTVEHGCARGECVTPGCGGEINA